MTLELTLELPLTCKGYKCSCCERMTTHPTFYKGETLCGLCCLKFSAVKEVLTDFKPLSEVHNPDKAVDEREIKLRKKDRRKGYFYEG